MPLVDANLAESYDGGANSLYQAADGSGLTRSAIWLSGYRADTEKLILGLEARGLVPGQYIGIVRSEFGWIAETFVDYGYGPIGDGTAAGRICCVDTSTWIQSNKGVQATINIVNADVNAATGRRAIRDQLGLKASDMLDWGVSYEVLPLLSDAECEPFAASMRALCTNVVHWLTPLRAGPPAQDPRMNWKSIAAWKTLMGTDLIAEMGTSNIT